MHLSVEDVFEAYEKYPSRIVPMYAPDPNSPDLEAKLLSWYQRGIKGCGENKVSLGWNSKKFDALLSCVNKLKLPFIFHMEECRDIFLPSSNSYFDRLLAKLFGTSKISGLPKKVIEFIFKNISSLNAKRKAMHHVFPGYLSNFTHLEKRLIEYPRVTFIGHGPLFWKAISLDWENNSSPYPRGSITEEGITCKLLSKYKNLYADISGPSGYNAIARDKTFAKRFLTQNRKKILYGTDNYEIGLKKLLAGLALSKKTYSHIYCENAFNILLK